MAVEQNLYVLTWEGDEWPVEQSTIVVLWWSKNAYMLPVYYFIRGYIYNNLFVLKQGPADCFLLFFPTIPQLTQPTQPTTEHLSC